MDVWVRIDTCFFLSANQMKYTDSTWILCLFEDDNTVRFPMEMVPVRVWCAAGRSVEIVPGEPFLLFARAVVGPVRYVRVHVYHWRISIFIRQW